ncbi:MAG: PDZ domain-containing protein [Planctomycetes bacterium]|nr:PDZ domain-containing protein [Planctomycetota bacterium]
MKPLLSMILAASALVFSAQLAAQEDVRVQIHKELQEVGKLIGEKIAKIVEENAKKSNARIAELEKALKDKDSEIAELKKRLDALAKEIAKEVKKPEPAPAQPPALTPAFIGIAHLEPSADLQAKLNLKPGQGALVSTILPGGPAEKAGLKEGDIILQVAGKEVGSENLSQAIRAHEPGKEIELVLLRGAEKMAKKVTLEHREKFVAKITPPVQPPQPAKPVEPAAPAKKEKAVWGILVEEADSGLLIQMVEKELTGDVAQLKEGDVIKAVNGKGVANLAELREAFDKVFAGDQASLEILRKGEAVTVKVIAGRDKGQAKLVEAKAPPKPPAEPPKEPKPAAPAAEKKPAYLGLSVGEGDGKVEVLSIQPNSAAASFGIKEKDLIKEINKAAVKTIDDLKKGLEGKFAGDKVELVLERGGQKVVIGDFVLGAKGEKAAAAPEEKPKAAEAPKQPEAPKAKEKGYLGISAQEAEDGTVIVSEIAAGGPAEKASLLKNDVILKVNGMPVKNFDDMARALQGTGAGDTITLVVRRGDKEQEIKVTLGKAG